MHKITDRCSLETQFSIPLPDEACSTVGAWIRQPGDEKDPQPAETVQLDPLYLFACRVLWHKDADAAAAWELIHGLKSTDQPTRVVVSALLCKRKTARELGVTQVRRIPFSPRYGS